MKLQIENYENKPCYVVDNWREYQRDGGDKKNCWYIVRDESSESFGYLVYRGVKRKIVDQDGKVFRLRDIQWIVTERKDVEDGEKILNKVLAESAEKLRKLGI